MENKYYSNERSVQILISILKANGIKKVVASPGTTNLTFLGSIQQDEWFEIYSSVDERSAAYIACGLSAECGEPVVLSCTGATASRNYCSGLTEAFYRKIPILAITSHQGSDRIGHLIPQQIDRRQIQNDTAKTSVEIPYVSDERTEHQAMILANHAILELKRNGGGPVHINLITRYSINFTVQTLPPTNIIRRYTIEDRLPSIPSGSVAIFVGAHSRFSDRLNTAIEDFCSSYNAAVFCDHTSGYYGKFRVQQPIVYTQVNSAKHSIHCDLLIHIGEVSGAEGASPSSKQVWRVSEDGEIRDTFGKLTNVFQMSEIYFFKSYIKENKQECTYVELCNQEYEKAINSLPDLPFSNCWVAKRISTEIPAPSVVHFGILNSLRSWNFFKLPFGVETSCNVGGFGIDGDISSLIGASLCDPNKIYFLFIGDLAFFYDLNVLGNRHVGNNVRIMLINNGCGSEFKMYNHRCYAFGDRANDYMAAAGHFGKQSPVLVKHFAEDLGYQYFSANTKEEFNDQINEFLSPNISRRMVFEVFTSDANESLALKTLRSSCSDVEGQAKKVLSETVHKVIGEQGVKTLKKFLKK